MEEPNCGSTTSKVLGGSLGRRCMRQWSFRMRRISIHRAKTVMLITEEKQIIQMADL